MTVYTRKSRLNEHYTERSLDDILSDQRPTPYDLRLPGVSRSALVERMVCAPRWRHHHGVPELIEAGDLYDAYVQRVDTMMTMIERALAKYDLLDFLPTWRVADLACSEGFMTRRLLELGALSVDGFEISSIGLERFAWIWNYFDLFDQGDVTAYVADLERAGWARTMPRKYDLVCCLGIIYHLENPLLFARNLHAITRRFCLVESDTPVFDAPARFRNGGVIYLNRDKLTIDDGEVRKLMELRPDREALVDILLTAGFSSVDVLESPPNATSDYYASGEKSVLFCRR